MRLDKYLAEGWVGQRKQVRGFIQEGRVSVNSVTILEAAYELEEKDVVQFDGQVVTLAQKRYYMFNKPTGCITARKDDRHRVVLDYFTEEEQAGLFPVGRLDKDTEGLLLLTNDGEFNHRLMDPKHHVEKTYYFWALGTITPEQKERIQRGVSIEGDGSLTKPARLELDKSGFYEQYASEIDGIKISPKEHNQRYQKPVVSGYLTITEGKKHQVKRMLRAVGCYVIALKRISIGELQLDEQLLPGQYRKLTQEELNLF